MGIIIYEPIVKTELGTTIEAGGNVSIVAKNDIKARNLTVSSESGAVKVIGEHDVLH